MIHIPFSALPLDERNAVLAALQRCGVAPRQVCVSRLEPAFATDPELLPTMAMVTAPGWLRVYVAGADWTQRLEQDLGVLRARAPAAAAQ